MEGVQNDGFAGVTIGAAGHIGELSQHAPAGAPARAGAPAPPMASMASASALAGAAAGARAAAAPGGGACAQHFAQQGFGMGLLSDNSNQALLLMAQQQAAAMGAQQAAGVLPVMAAAATAGPLGVAGPLPPLSAATAAAPFTMAAAGTGPAVLDPADVAKLLAAASDAVAEQRYQAGSGPVSVALDEQQWTIRDQQPTQLRQLVDWPIVGDSMPFQPHMYSWLALHNSRLVGMKLLQQQPAGSTGSMYRLGGPSGPLVSAKPVLSPPGPKSITPTPITSQPNLHYGLGTGYCVVQLRPQQAPASAVKDEKACNFAKVQLRYEFVFREKQMQPVQDPYWRSWDDSNMVVGCVCRVTATGKVTKAAFPDFTAAIPPGGTLPTLCLQQQQSTPGQNALVESSSVAEAAAGPPVGAAAFPAATAAAAAASNSNGLSSQLPAGLGGLGGSSQEHIAPQGPVAWHVPVAGSAAAAAATPAVPPPLQGAAQLANAALQDDSLHQLFEQFRAGVEQPMGSSLPQLEFGGVPGEQLADLDSLLFGGNSPAVASGWAAGEQLLQPQLAQLLLPPPPQQPLQPLQLPQPHQQLQSLPPELQPRPQQLPAQPHTDAVADPAVGLYGVRREGSRDDSDDGNEAVPELGIMAPAGDPVWLRPVEEQTQVLRYRLLRLAAGFHGDSSMQALEQLRADMLAHNATQARAGAIAGPHFVSLLDARETWFLQRSVLHLLVSDVRVWGIDAEMTPSGLPDAMRRQLLDEMCSNWIGSPGLKQLLCQGNRNKATPFFTACHFCNPAALDWLLSRPELTFPRMLRSSKRGKLCYHITSTQAAEKLRAGDNAQYQQLRSGMVKMLCAFYAKLQVWLNKLTPEQLEAQKDKVPSALQAQIQQAQQRWLSSQHRLAEAGSPRTPGPPAPGLGAAASEAAAAAAAGAGAAVASGAGAMLIADSRSLGVPVLAAAAQQLQPGHDEASNASSSENRAGSVDMGPVFSLSQEEFFWLHHVLFHTQWQSSRQPPHKSPDYHGTLFGEVVRQLFGFEPRTQQGL